MLTVVARASDGRRSTSYEFRFGVSSAPAVSSAVYPPDYEAGGGVGVPGTFIFSSAVPGVVSFGYNVDLGPDQTVAAGPAGSASITYTPDCPCVLTMRVWGVMENGERTDERYYTFTVAH